MLEFVVAVAYNELSSSDLNWKRLEFTEPLAQRIQYKAKCCSRFRFFQTHFFDGDAQVDHDSDPSATHLGRWSHVSALTAVIVFYVATVAL